LCGALGAGPIKEIDMSWKVLVLQIAVLAFCTTLQAQDEPFVGVWELNAAKTLNYQRGKQTIINVPAPGGFQSSRISHGDQRDARIEIHSYIFDGNFHRTEGGDPREISYERLDANTIERTTRRNGQITIDKEEISKDGRTLTVTQANSTRVFDKTFTVQQLPH
jgi:hypothetical protein